MVEQPTINVVRRYLQSLQEAGLAVCFGVVFGSRATGKASPLSDIDLVVVSPRFDGSPSRQDVNLLWRRAARIDSRIEPVACGERQWRHDDSSAVIEIARREGTPVDIDDVAPA